MVGEAVSGFAQYRQRIGLDWQGQTYNASVSSRAFSVCRRCLGFFSVGDLDSAEA